ncbi:YlbF family regulator [Lachnospiraceae bacterium C1.1]|nr:YlbF family regulator [Lachnospiraceae bacterium C1.1]
MDKNLDRSIDKFIDAVKETSEYRNYKTKRHIVMDNPELRGKASKLIKEHYRILTTTADDQLLDAEMEFADKYEDTYNIPEIHDYLEAELRFNEMLQNVLERITGGLSL